MSEVFSTFFLEKIQCIKDSIKQKIGNSRDNTLWSDIKHSDPFILTDLRPPTADEVFRLI
jgi:hypothetical protein